MITSNELKAAGAAVERECFTKQLRDAARELEQCQPGLWTPHHIKLGVGRAGLTVQLLRKAAAEMDQLRNERDELLREREDNVRDATKQGERAERLADAVYQLQLALARVQAAAKMPSFCTDCGAKKVNNDCPNDCPPF